MEFRGTVLIVIVRLSDNSGYFKEVTFSVAVPFFNPLTVEEETDAIVESEISNL